MSILMGLMAVIMVIGIISGHKHMKGGHDKGQRNQESAIEDSNKRRFCDGCPAGLVIKDGTAVKEEGSDKNKSDEEVGK